MKNEAYELQKVESKVMRAATSNDSSCGHLDPICELPPDRLSSRARYLRETRIMAAVFLRYWKLEMHWRTELHRRQWEAERAQILARSEALIARLLSKRRAISDNEFTVITDLPHCLPRLREEIAILRAFVAHDIDRILFGDDT